MPHNAAPYVSAARGVTLSRAVYTYHVVLSRFKRRRGAHGCGAAGIFTQMCTQIFNSCHLTDPSDWWVWAGVSGITARMAVETLQPQLANLRKLLDLAVDALVNPQELSTPQGAQ